MQPKKRVGRGSQDGRWEAQRRRVAWRHLRLPSMMPLMM